MKKKTFLVEFLHEGEVEVAILRNIKGEPVSVCELSEVADRLRVCDDKITNNNVGSHEHEQ